MNLILFGLVVALLWAIAPLIHKYLLTHTNYKVIMLLSAVTYVIVMCIYSIVNYNDIFFQLKQINTKNIILIIFVSLITLVIANIIYLSILQNNNSYVVCALTYSSPIFTLIFAYLFFKEKVTLLGLFGVIFVVIGIICLAFNN
jgi:uncharacterized membrane protein